MNNKTEQAYEQIKRKIITGDISNQNPISVNGLSINLDMSKTPVRDALHKLQTEGFVRIIPNQGIVVQELTVAEVTQMYELRVAIEEYLVKKAMNLIADTHIDHFRKIIDKQRTAMECNDPFEFMKYDNEQHLYIHQVYYNPIIFNVVNRMTDRIFYGGVQALRIPGRMSAVLDEHIQIVDALEARNVEQFNQALENHFTQGLSSTTISVERSRAN
ncbi:MAG: GntR family transcriptional regulator [Pseudomonadota bacterium]